MRDKILQRINQKYDAIYNFVYNRVFEHPENKAQTFCPEECISFCIDQLPKAIAYYEKTNFEFNRKRFDNYLFNMFLTNKIKDYFDTRGRLNQRNAKKAAQYEFFLKDREAFDQEIQDALEAYLTTESSALEVSKKFNISNVKISRILKKLTIKEIVA